MNAFKLVFLAKACFKVVVRSVKIPEAIVSLLLSATILNNMLTSSAKACHVRTTTEFNFITPAYRYTQWLSIPSVSNVKCQLVFFFGGHFADQQGHNWNSGTNGGHQLGDGDGKY